MKIEEIKNILEKKKSSKIIDFVINYNFKDNYDDYYLKYILNYDFKNPNVLLSAYIIELAYYKRLKQIEIKELFKRIIISKYNYLLKISILDYFIDLKIPLKKNEIIVLQKYCLRSHSLLKVQILILNIFYNYETRWSFDKLINILNKKKCTHIEIIRILNLFIKYPNKINTRFSKNQIENLNNSLKYFKEKYKSTLERYEKFIGIYKVG